MIGLAYCDRAGRIYYDETRTPLADGGIVREVHPDELIPAPPGTVTDDPARPARANDAGARCAAGTRSR